VTNRSKAKGTAAETAVIQCLREHRGDNPPEYEQYGVDPLPDGRCGTYAGWNAHRRAGQRVCLACLHAQRAYMREYRRQGRDKSLRALGWGTTCVRGLGWPR
jgi:hypothetical protein